MNAGVSTSPWASPSRPRRAPPSVERTLKSATPVGRIGLLVVRHRLDARGPRADRVGQELRELRLGLSRRDARDVTDPREEDEIRGRGRCAGEIVALELAGEVVELARDDLARR